MLRNRTPLLAALTMISVAGSISFGQESPAKPTLPDSWVKNVEWRSIGPANMMGRIPALTVYEKDPCIWWAASASGGLLKTTNNGVTFEHQFDKEATVSIGDVKVAQSDPNILWVGTGEGNPRNSVSWGDGVYKSTDGGKTWKNMGLKKIFQTGRIEIHPTNPDIVYVGALGRLWGPSEERGLFKTTDGGKTWERILYVDDKTGVVDVQMNQDDPDTLYVATYERKRDGFDGNDPAVKFGTGAGIYRTTDGGKSFTKLSAGLPTVKMGRIGLSIYRKNPKFVYAVVETEKIGKAPENMAYAGLSGSDAEVGAKLTRVTNNGPAAKAGLKVNDIVISMNGTIVNSYNEFIGLVRKQKVGDKAKLVVSRDRKTKEVEITFAKAPAQPTGNRRTFGRRGGAGGNPFSQSLGGQNANLQDQQGEDGYQHGGIFRSKDGGDTWERINSLNPRPMYYSQIRVDPSDNNHIWVLGTSLYKSKDGGKTFTGDGHGRDVHVDHHSMWIDPKNGEHVILGNDGGVYITWDRGKAWDHHNHAAIGQFYHVGVAPNRNYHVYGGLQDNGSWGGPSRVLNDSGSNNSDWYRVGSGDGFIVLIDPKDKDQVYFESQNGAMGRIHLKSGERGFIRPRGRYRFNWKTPFILSPHNSQIHYSAGNHVFRSVYKGDGIKEISPEITNTDKGAGSAIAESPREEGVIWVGTTDGALWVTTDGGKAWVNLFKDPASVKPPVTPARTRGGLGRGLRGRRPGGPGGAGNRPERPESGEPSRPQGEGESRPAPSVAARMVQLLRRRDANKDGKIQKSEVNDSLKRLFDRIDTNSDGVLDEKELKAFGGGGKTVFTSFQEDKQAAPAADDIVSGVWSGKFLASQIPAERAQFTLTLRLAKDGKVTGKMEGGFGRQGSGDITGKFDAQKKTATLTVETGQASIEFNGTFGDKTLEGNIDINGGAFSLDFEAKRTGGVSAAAAGADDAEQSSDSDGKGIKDLVPGPRWVSSLSASKFSSGRCYMTLDGHRSNDDEPYVFVTEDYGKTWKSIRANLPTGAGTTRVIREDIENRNVLYLGCEFSAWVSIDRGESWTKFNNNLPTVAIHEFAIHPTAGEIVAGTHGRSLWIADVTALRQMSAMTVAEDAHLYKPNSVIRWRRYASRGSVGTRAFKAPNAAGQANISYSLGKNARSVKLRISNLRDETIYETDGETTAGLHNIKWNLQRSAPTTGNRPATGQRRFGGRRGGFRGRTVGTGTYLVTLTVDGNQFKQEIVVESDPENGTPVTTEEEYELMKAVYGVEDEEDDDDGERID